MSKLNLTSEPSNSGKQNRLYLLLKSVDRLFYSHAKNGFFQHTDDIFLKAMDCLCPRYLFDCAQWNCGNRICQHLFWNLGAKIRFFFNYPGCDLRSGLSWHPCLYSPVLAHGSRERRPQASPDCHWFVLHWPGICLLFSATLHCRPC